MTSESDFHAAMEHIYDIALNECEYRASRFIQMVRADGGLETARKLLESDELSDGLTTLWEADRLDISMEALVVSPRWRHLFSEEELVRAQERLAALGYEG